MKNQYDRSSITGDEPATGIVQGREFFEPGLTIRQHFAAMAMQGLLANKYFQVYKEGELSTDKLSRTAVDAADALIEELNKLQK